MEITIEVNNWFEVVKGTTGDIMIGTSGVNGNLINLIIKKENKKYFESLVDSLNDLINDINTQSNEKTEEMQNGKED